VSSSASSLADGASQDVDISLLDSAGVNVILSKKKIAEFFFSIFCVCFAKNQIP
jgi:hypothetical protein